MESPSRRRIENPRPEAGLVEWTSRIKALQHDVDADEEIEQRKLEEEIRASRLARSRRSGGAQFAGKVPLSVIPDDKASSPADALRKLTGEPTSPVPVPSTTTKPLHVAERTPSNMTASKAEPVSLAAFIGGRATGPRLNRPAAQPDAHDPTLFEQRTRADITAPHPVFGSGGVALVGLAGKGREVVELKTPERVMPVKEEVRNININVKPAAVASVAPVRGWARERTVSSPSPYVPPKPVERSPPPMMPTGAPSVRGRMESLYANANRSVERITSPPILRSSKSIDKLPQRPAAPAKPEALRKPQQTVEALHRISPARPSSTTPPSRIQTPASTISARPTSVSPPVSVPSLARPVQPQQRPLSTGPAMPMSKKPAPAFLKPAQQKDLTPSLSRLQGRGFVQSFVKLSSEIEAASSGPPERTASPKRGSVFDRWNPPSPSPNASPVSAPPMRKAKTLDAPRTAQPELAAAPAPAPAPALESVRPTPQPKPRSHTDSVKSTPIKTKTVPAPGDVLPLGSSNTLISYIKPTKTGDAPATDASEAPHPRSKTPSRHTDENASGVNEFGMRPRSRNSKASSPGPTKAASYAKPDLASSVASGRPLSHPTKDRAKVRRRVASGQAPTENVEHAPTVSIPDKRAVPDSSPDFLSTRLATSSVQETASPIAKPDTAYLFSSISQREEPLAAYPVQGRGDSVQRLQDTWVNQAPISVKPLRKSALATDSPGRTTFNVSSKLSKYALPGLAVENTTVSPPSPPLTPPLSLSARQERKTSSPSPVRHSRIPSTGSRATVMDVAQAFNGAASPTSPSFPKSPVGLASPRSPVTDTAEEDEHERDPGCWGEAGNERTITPAIMKAERRRSNYEKYASFTLPVLPEEKTPASSPVGTLKKGVDVVALSASNGTANESEARAEKPVLPKKPDFVRAPSKIHIDAVDEPVPAINAAKIWDVSPQRFFPDPDVHTVSVDVLNVEGGSAIDIAKGTDNMFVFYETETLAIVHRAKSRSSGLVATKVWAWCGRQVEVGEREKGKMQELAKRYGTVLMKCGQCEEPQELVHVLGGSLAIRQGKRSLWSSEDTTMHMVRSSVGVVLIDEVDLNVKNLCSGFSCCISLLDTLWVWYGCGSVPTERNAALRYAQTLSSSTSGKNVVEVEEGQEDEMFWTFLGEDGYASADYWKWRKSENGVNPRFWRVDCASNGSEVKELESFPSPSDVSSAVIVVHLAYEIFTLVGSAARGQRRNIKLGLTLAQELSSHTARSKPFRPPVHVLIFPSQIPLDLKAAVRGLDADVIHDSEEVPDHMNLLTLNDAWTQIRQKVWDQIELEDGNMMPLGFTPH